MREYGIVASTFWMRGSGKALRGHPLAQLVALYLFTSPHAEMTGLYYLPLPTLAHELGCPIEGASKALARVIEGGVAFYDAPSEVVWVPEMARYQIAQSLSPSDKRVEGVRRAVQRIGAHPLARAFWTKYQGVFSLGPLPSWLEGVDVEYKPLASPLEGASEPHRSQDQDHEQDQDQDQKEFAPCVPPVTTPPLALETTAPKVRKPKAPKPAPVPLPWSVADLLGALAESSRGRVVVAPFVPALAPQVTVVIRSLAEVGCTLSDVRLAGEWIAAGGLSWMHDGVGLSWVARTGALAEAIGKARVWDKGGRRPVASDAPKITGQAMSLEYQTPPSERRARIMAMLERQRAQSKARQDTLAAEKGTTT